MKKEKRKKLKLKKGNIIKAIILLMICIDIISMFINLIIGNIITYLGMIIFIIEILTIYLLLDSLKKDYK